MHIASVSIWIQNGRKFFHLVMKLKNIWSTLGPTPGSVSYLFNCFMWSPATLCHKVAQGGWYFHETPGDRNLRNQKRLTNNTRFNTEITKAFWNEKTSKWELTAKENGNESVVECNWLISCIGGLHKPMIPEFKGRETFKGRTFSCSSPDALARAR